ncbi:Rv3235 family protein [Cellulomonas oligotrophica]|uniref:Uncharacterized protein n=1 Tax=Cellulomonas oligotrophica TaxID=931536 RepID=A0A7Y9JX16_9CELL|nr:Rv3235 family protein [Cellulomonas oligotrophica]NYD85187.1 hypothetical protein [Cellulomonas oligotrophica]GIG34162.1 hypothetical protein Col01nite_33210 [Cellulomonas oligotrophica]
MTLLAADDVVPTGLEDAFGSLAHAGASRHPRSAGDRSSVLRPVPSAGQGTARTAPRDVSPARRARVRLVPDLAPAAVPVAAPPVVPTTLGRRVQVLRAADRTVVVDAADEERGPVPTADPALLTRRVGLACVEVALGRRPVAQLARWLAPGVLEQVRVRAALAARAGARPPAHAPRARRVRACAVDEHTVEACLVVDDGTRVRAVALRLESHRGSWQVTTLEIG